MYGAQKKCLDEALDCKDVFAGVFGGTDCLIIKSLLFLKRVLLAKTIHTFHNFKRKGIGNVIFKSMIKLDGGRGEIMV